MGQKAPKWQNISGKAARHCNNWNTQGSGASTNSRKACSVQCFACALFWFHSDRTGTKKAWKKEGDRKEKLHYQTRLPVTTRLDREQQGATRGMKPKFSKSWARPSPFLQWPTRGSSLFPLVTFLKPPQNRVFQSNSTNSQHLEGPETLRWFQFCFFAPGDSP